MPPTNSLGQPIGDPVPGWAPRPRPPATPMAGRRGEPVGVASYLRIDPAMGTIEVGHLAYSPALQRTPLATEAMYLMMRRAFDELGYRRTEWKCDSLNAPSVAAALRSEGGSR